MVEPLKERLFKVILRVTKVKHDEAEKLAQETVKAFLDADPFWEYWSHGEWGTINMEFTTNYSIMAGADQGAEQLARMVGGMVWRSIGEFREPLKVKVDLFSDFGGNTPIYVLDQDVFWCDVWDQDFIDAMGITPKDEKKAVL